MLLSLVWLSILISTNAQQVQKITCFPSGLCEPCPAIEMLTEACRPFGNRRPLTCTLLTALNEASKTVASDVHFVTDEDDGKLGLALLRNKHNASTVSVVKKRDFFWQDQETSMQKAAKLIEEVDWNSVRQREAVEAHILNSGGSFGSWTPCARVVLKERSDFGEFVVSLFNNDDFAKLRTALQPGLCYHFTGSPILQTQESGSDSIRAFGSANWIAEWSGRLKSPAQISLIKLQAA